MWRIEHFETRKVRMDFSSSGQASPEVTQIVVGETRFANALQFTSWEDDRVQVLVCESCGVEGCEVGGWLSPRAAGEHVIFLPAFSDMQDGETEQVEYGPPPYVATNGIPAFPDSTYAQLRERCPGLRPVDSLPRLTGAELLRVLQLEAPAEFLGRFPAAPAPRRDRILAVSHGHDVDAVFARLSFSLHELARSAAVVFRAAVATDKEITFHLDGSGTQQWTPLIATDAGRWLLSPMPGFVVEG